MDMFLDLERSNGLTLDLGGSHELTITQGIGSIRVVEVKFNRTSYWESYPTYVPSRGELIVYSDYISSFDGQKIPALKVGDGNAYLVDLPFVSGGITPDIVQRLLDHINNTDVHVTPQQKVTWSDKLNYDVDENNENLIFNKE